MSVQTKEARLELRLTEIEKAELQDRAAAQGISVSELIRRQLLGATPVTEADPMGAERRIRQLQSQGLTSLAARRIANLESS
jgi:hypothetical protein